MTARPDGRNDLYAEEYGITAQIVPMLLGFFTYKISTIIEVIQPRRVSATLPSQRVGAMVLR
jgi:HrpA-like RNA helicase